MFWHNFKYAMHTTLKNKTTLIWTLLFPIALTTFMYMSFGNLFEEKLLDIIPVAVVIEEENEAFETTLEELSEDGKNKMLEVTFTEEEEALEQLKQEEVQAIIYVAEDIRLKVLGNSYEATVVKTIVEEFDKINEVVKDIAMTNPQAIEKTIENLTADTSYFTKVKTSDGNQDVYTNYFYAIFAMSCLFASFISCEKIQKIQANVSPLGMRRCLSPNNKMTTIIAEYVAMFITQFIIELITLAYMIALGVDFGDKYLQIAIILFFGSSVGISFGVITGSLTRFSKSTKEGICVAVSMALAVLSDLVAGGIKYAIEQHAPIINRLNPSALITDSFYALNIYDTYDRYLQNITILGAMSVGLIVVSYLILRRNKYASL